MQTTAVLFIEHPPSVRAQTAQGNIELSALWLREKTEDQDSIDQLTRQRLFDSHMIDEMISLTEVKPEGTSQAFLTFSDGHHALYSSAEILAEINDSKEHTQSEAWDSKIDMSLVRHDWGKMGQDKAFATALTAYLRYGFIVLNNVPNTREQVLTVGSKFGYVKETNFGRFFEVYSKPHANDLAYRSVRLGPHTDNPYRDPVPGIQLLHCLVNETTGGLSTLVDSVKVVGALKAEDPNGYRLLKETPVRFRFVDQGVELKTWRPMISTDHDGNTLGVHYSPRLDSLPLLSGSETVAFHRARKRLAELFNHPDYELRFRLAAGELMLFDNSRVLHGRTSYDPSEGHRHLQGCYIDLDGPRERFSEIVKRAQRSSEAA
ncbi:gamma-butyrobetaine hydroxylase [Pseudomonas aeruginosa]|uniref:TauD/TfdA family dioxygenase n=1 Tax=Pseudomonas aeruginosa TaxID=287 RepID=UPI00114E4525|nr:TauD/TfdA family dioxygenase [Pseudomonas aeruginosa]TQI33209.1 gamma-butyrobetaine hydroxylase [Pseudomonas aeruginosa]